MPQINEPEVAIGAAAGLAGPVLGMIAKTVTKALAYEETCKSVESKVDSVIKLTVCGQAYNEKLGDRNLGGSRQNELKDILQTAMESKEVIRNMDVEGPKVCRKPLYTSKLNEMDESLKRPLELVQFQGVVNGMENLLVTKEMSKDLKDASADVKEVLVVTKDTSSDVKDMKKALPVIMNNAEDVKEIAERISNQVVQIRGLQEYAVIDAKENLVVAKEFSEDIAKVLPLIKDTNEIVKNLPDFIDLFRAFLGEIDESPQIAELRKVVTTKMGISYSDLYVTSYMRHLEFLAMEDKDVSDKLGSMIEAAQLGATLSQLHSMVTTYTKRSDPYMDWLAEFYERQAMRINSIFTLIEKKTGKDKALSSVPTEELRKFWEQLEVGVELVHNSIKVEVWDDDLKSEYTHKFLQLEKTLEALYDRLDGIHPLKWRKYGNCGGSCRTSGTTTSMSDPVLTTTN